MCKLNNWFINFNINGETNYYVEENICVEFINSIFENGNFDGYGFGCGNPTIDGISFENGKGFGNGNGVGFGLENGSSH